MSDNPFQGPGDDALARHAGVQQALRGTRWAVLVVSGFFALGVALMVCGGVAMMAMSAVGLGADDPDLSPWVMVGIGAVYLVLAALYVAPTWLLFSYGRDLGAFLVNPTAERLVAALERQRKFWAIAAVLLVALVVLYVAIIGVAVIAGVAAAAGGA